MTFTDLITLSLNQAVEAGAGSTLANLLPILLMFVVLYFLMIRPQMKRQKEHRKMVSELTKGDEVITAGGLLGVVSRVTENYIALEVSQHNGSSVEVLCQRVAVSAVLPKGTMKDLAN